MHDPGTRVKRILVPAAAIAGMLGPLLLGGMIALLTVVQYDFMLSLGWQPLRAPTTDWPSGLALGPYGTWMVGTFVVSGGLVVLFALGLEQALARTAPRAGIRLLALAGIATMLLAFKTDPTYRSTGRTVAGTIHDSAFALLGVSLLAALLLLAARFRGDSRWRGHALYTVLTALLVAPAFALKELWFYAFLLNILLWFEWTAWRLWQITS